MPATDIGRRKAAPYRSDCDRRALVSGARSLMTSLKRQEKAQPSGGMSRYRFDGECGDDIVDLNTDRRPMRK